jgi:1-acyl-sn-glycerol-3-phosphate acyltransferase
VIEGAENIPKGKRQGYVVIANHQSFLDINAIFAGICPSAFIAKEELWRIPVFGKLLSHTGAIPIHRGASRANTRIGALLKKRIDEGYMFTIFPEGQRSENEKMLPFKNGIFHMAKEYHYDLLPVTILHAGKILPKHGVALFPGELKLVIHKLVTPEEYVTLPLEKFRENLRDTIASALPQNSEAKET